MSSLPKQFHEGYWYHVYARSIEEVPLFCMDSEREWFLEKLDDVFTRRQVSLGALCLMDTHYHALLKMGPVRLDRALNGLHMSYAQHINTQRDRRGTVFEKHPGTDIILDHSYLLQVVPYIHKNPVEAGLVQRPEQYEWSTDGFYRGNGWEHGLLESWDWPPYFEDDDRSRVYRERMGEDTEIPRSDDGYIGTDDEWNKLERRDESREDRYRDRRNRHSLKEIAGTLANEAGLKISDLKEQGRSQPEADIRQRAMAQMYEEGYGPTEIGEYFNRSKGTVSHAVKKFGGN